MPKRAFDDNGGIPPWVTMSPKMAKAMEPPSDDPYCAMHGKRFDPSVGCPECLTDEGTVYRSPASVPCPTCRARPEQPCQHLNGSGIMMHGWHPSRERVE